MSQGAHRNAAGWNDRDSLIEILSEKATKGRCLIFLGAGVSKPLGAPSWKELLESLYNRAGATFPSGGATLESLAEQYETNHCASRRELIEHVEDCLYSDVDISFQSLRKQNLLAAVASLAMVQSKDKQCKIVTLNYDNILELYLSYHGFIVESVGETSGWAPSSDINVLHPHGLVPHNSTGNENNFVFTQADYDLVYQSKWSGIIESALSERMPIFIGVSGNDNHLASLLTRAKLNHPATSDGSPYWGVTFSTSYDVGQELFWKNRGIYPKQIDNYDEDLPQILFDVCQVVSKRRQKI